MVFTILNKRSNGKYMKRFITYLFIIIFLIVSLELANKALLSTKCYKTDYDEISFAYYENVYIYPTSPQNKEFAKKAMELWKTETDGTVNLVEVKEPHEANIRIKFVDKFSIKRPDDVIGFSQTEISGYNNLYTKRLEREYENNIEILNIWANTYTVIHELGHAIGLNEHSLSLTSAMKPFFLTGYVKIYPEDIKRIKLLPIGKNSPDEKRFFRYYNFTDSRSYYINTCNKLDYNANECALAKSAFKDWQNVKGVKSSNFNTYTTGYTYSDLDVKFVDTIDNANQLGHVHYEVHGGRLYITILIARRGFLPDDSSNTIVKLTSEQQKAILLHEIGHACGIFDSKNDKSIMYPYGNLKNKLSTKNDIEIVEKEYFANKMMR